MKTHRKTRQARANHEYVKKINTSMVLNCVRKHGPISRAEIARKTELYPATVSSLVNDLLEQGFIRESGVGVSTGGRHPVLLEVNSKIHRVMGVAISNYVLRVGLVDLLGNIVSKAELPINDAVPQGIIERVVDLVEQVQMESAVEENRILGFGASFPGPVDSETGTILASPILPGWGKYSLRESLGSNLGMTCRVDNDVNAALSAERWFGSVFDDENALYVMFDWGIGGGIFIGGHVYRGRNHAAGEFGHMVVDVEGEQCFCGNFGCLHTLASGEAIVRRWCEQAASPGDISTETGRGTLEYILQAADDGDHRATSILDQAGRFSGIALAGLINAFAPDKVVVGGIVPYRSATFFRRLSETAMRRAWSSVTRGVDIRRSSLGPDSFLLGAAALVLDDYFQVPKV